MLCGAVPRRKIAYFAQLGNMPHNGHRRPTQCRHRTQWAHTTSKAPTWSKMTCLDGVVVSNASPINKNRQRSIDFGICGGQIASKMALGSHSYIDLATGMVLCVLMAFGKPLMSVGSSSNTKLEKPNFVYIFKAKHAHFAQLGNIPHYSHRKPTQRSNYTVRANS